jgi:hypothetical protein
MCIPRLLSVLGFVLLAQVAAAQITVTNTCPVDAPVELHPGAVPTAGEHLVATITNRGPKPITGVILSWRVTDSGGAFYSETSTVDYAPSGILFESGKSTQAEVDLSVKEGSTLKTVEVTCVAVLYQGKGVWGDANAPEVARLRAIRQGINSERQRLLSVYKKEGIARLTDELNRPVVR